jgi:hypothetical protein
MLDHHDRGISPGGQAHDGVIPSSVNVEVRFPGPCCWAVMYTCVLSSPSCELVYHTQSPETEAHKFSPVSLTTPDSGGVAFDSDQPEL